MRKSIEKVKPVPLLIVTYSYDWSSLMHMACCAVR